ncbi:hypothetical protein [Microbacterium gorillae]|uniref:hypothetical protein n=1 Tax=Microbacterium gorillae TaxID=1231063 RepID=UPI00058AFBCE|nr:hypothetical protein [Microbacterium gorillae]
MDMLDRVALLTPADAAERVDLNPARNALHREIARGHRRNRRGLGITIGASAGGLVTAGVVVAAVVAGSVVAPSTIAPVQHASAAELLNAAALEIEENPVVIPAGSYLKAEAHWITLNTVVPGQISWEGGFSRTRAGAPGAVLIDLEHTLYEPGSEADPMVISVVPKHPIQVFGDEAAVAQTWNGGVLNEFGDLATSLTSAPAAEVYETLVTADAPMPSPLGISLTPEQSASLSPVDDLGEFPTDPQKFLDATVDEFATDGLAAQIASTRFQEDALQGWIDSGRLPSDHFLAGVMDPTPGTTVPLTEDTLAYLQSSLDELRKETAGDAAALEEKKSEMAAWTPAERASHIAAATAELVRSTQLPEFATASATFRATVLRAIALAPDLTIESTDGDIANIIVADADATLKVKLDTATAQVVQVDSYLKRYTAWAATPTDEDPTPVQTVVEVGSSPLIPADVPDERYTLTTEIVPQAPSPTQ